MRNTSVLLNVKTSSVRTHTSTHTGIHTYTHTCIPRRPHSRTDTQIHVCMHEKTPMHTWSRVWLDTLSYHLHVYTSFYTHTSTSMLLIDKGCSVCTYPSVFFSRRCPIISLALGDEMSLSSFICFTSCCSPEAWAWVWAR